MIVSVLKDFARGEHDVVEGVGGGGLFGGEARERDVEGVEDDALDTGGREQAS